jgi:three-Cys-motif partner protein
MKRKRKLFKKSAKFFAEQTAQSRVKATIITKYFGSRMKIISGSGATKMVYVDLYAGRGTYEKGAVESTPLLVLRQAIQDPLVSKSLVTIFNDKDHADALRAAINALPGVEDLRYKPAVSNMEVGATTPELFEKIRLAPTLAFLDPWGYKGLSRALIHSLLKDWACEVLFFFNFNRVNMDITNEIVRLHMEALFGAKRLTALRAVVAELEGEARGRAVMTALFDMLRDIGGQFILPFRFVKGTAQRTSHYLIFVTKNFLGYKIMRDVMAKASSTIVGDVASFEYNPRPALFLSDGRSVEALAEMLVTDFAGMALTVEQVFERGSIGKLYTARNYKDALMYLEAGDRVSSSRPASERRKGTLADDIVITFPRSPGNGLTSAAPRSTPDRRAAALPTSASARPTA